MAPNGRGWFCPLGFGAKSWAFVCLCVSRSSFCQKGISPVWFGVYEAVVTEPLAPDPGEIAWQGWLRLNCARSSINCSSFREGGKLCADMSGSGS